VQLAAVAAEGMEARWDRHRRMAEMTWAWVDRLRTAHGEAFGVLAHEGHRTPTVTSITIPSTFAASTLVKAVADRGFTIGNGYGKNRETTFRIGHMGDHVPERLAEVLEVCGEVIAELVS
jgi:aspartate aminotransferase-like enzyme